jgi:hypothetical protein
MGESGDEKLEVETAQVMAPDGTRLTNAPYPMHRPVVSHSFGKRCRFVKGNEDGNSNYKRK